MRNRRPKITKQPFTNQVLSAQVYPYCTIAMRSLEAVAGKHEKYKENNCYKEKVT